MFNCADGTAGKGIIMIRRIVFLCFSAVLALALVASCATGVGRAEDKVGGLAAMDIVAGGTIMTSSRYQLVLTTGQGPGGNAVMTSPGYRLQAGLVGVTE